MVRESRNGDTDPYSAWHRTLPEWLGLMDLDAIEYNGQVTLSVYLEYNNDDKEVVGCLEIININSQSGGELPVVPEKFPTEYPIDDSDHGHKQMVLNSFSSQTAVPVFVVWVCWGTVKRKNGNIIDYADPKAFYIRELPDKGETDLTPAAFEDFLKNLRGLDTKRTFPFKSM